MNASRRYFVLVAMAGAFGSTTAQAKKELPRVAPATIVAKYGPPDLSTTTEGAIPRPPVVTRFLDYRKEGVRFILVPDAPMGAAPPYAHWLLFAITDPITNKPLLADEVKKRLASRALKK